MSESTTTTTNSRNNKRKYSNSNANLSERRELNLEMGKNSRMAIIWMRWILIGMISLGYFYYSTLNEMTESIEQIGKVIETQQQDIADMNNKIGIIVTADKIYQGNVKAFSVSAGSAKCARCHLVPTMYLLKSDITLSSFKEYVRGSKRHTDNKIMPMFTKDIISDESLEEMYMILKYSFNVANRS